MFESFQRPVRNIRNMRTFLAQSKQLSWSTFQPRDVWIVIGLCELHIKFMRLCLFADLWSAALRGKCKRQVQIIHDSEIERRILSKNVVNLNMQEQISYPCHPCSLHCLSLKRLTFYCNFVLCIRIKIIYTTRDVLKTQHITMIITSLVIISRGSICHSANHYSEAQLWSWQPQLDLFLWKIFEEMVHKLLKKRMK